MPFVIQGTAQGKAVYWRKWTGASVSGRPRWVDRLTLKCLYVQQTINGSSSSHFRHSLTQRDGTVVPVTNVTVLEVTELP